MPVRARGNVSLIPLYFCSYLGLGISDSLSEWKDSVAAMPTSLCRLQGQNIAASGNEIASANVDGALAM